MLSTASMGRTLGSRNSCIWSRRRPALASCMRQDPGRPMPEPATVALGGGRRSWCVRDGQVEGRRSRSIRVSSPGLRSSQRPGAGDLSRDRGADRQRLAAAGRRLRADRFPGSGAGQSRRGGGDPSGRSVWPPRARTPIGFRVRQHCVSRPSLAPGGQKVSSGVLGRLHDEADAASWPQRPHGARRARGRGDRQEGDGVALQAARAARCWLCPRTAAARSSAGVGRPRVETVAALRHLRRRHVRA